MAHVTYEQGDVLVAEDPSGNAPRRPYLVVSEGVIEETSAAIGHYVAPRTS